MNTYNKNLMVTIICLIYGSSINAFEFGGIYYEKLLPEYLRNVKVTYPPKHPIGYTSYPSLNGSLRITRYLETYGQYGNYTIRIIGKYAFEKCTGLTSVIIDDQVQTTINLIEIEEHAFRGCTGLTSVTIGNNVKSVGKWAFKGCSSITHLVIGKNLEDIHESALYGCYNIKKIYVRAINPPHISIDLDWDDDLRRFQEMIKNAIVYVPIGCVDKYKNSAWGIFFNADNIVEEMSGVDDVVNDKMPADEVERFTIDGRKISSPIKGINVIRYSDGSTHKVLVK